MPNERQLREIARKLQLNGIQHVAIQEIDPPWDGQMTAIGIVPLSDRTQVKKILSSLPLLGKTNMPGQCENAQQSNLEEDAEIRPPGTMR